MSLSIIECKACLQQWVANETAITLQPKQEITIVLKQISKCSACRNPKKR